MKRIFCILLVLILSLSFIPVKADLLEDERPVFSADDYLIDPTDSMPVAKIENSAAAAILIEAESGQVLYESNADERLPIASVTKVMTLLLTMEAIDDGKIKLTDSVTVSEYAASMGGSQAFMEAGETMSVHDMLKAVAVSSCNDAAVALAEHLSGSEEAFVEKMNERAEKLKMTSTEFVNCTGLDDNEMHYSSARDVSLMSKELISHPLIFDYTTIWMDTIRNGEFGLSNTNKLIRFYKGATGLKTGSTSKARYCLSATAERDGLPLIAVVLGAKTSADRFSAAKGLLDYGFANFSVYHPKSELPDTIKVWGGKENHVKCTYDLSPIVMNKGERGRVEEKVEMKKDVTAPVKKGDVIGTITFSVDGKLIATSEIKAEHDVKKATFLDRFARILKGIYGGE
ncbi:MAG: D-alanyl-D-alanine carboxypeptidase [Ruminococcaceae bacterium]|nr:D-alanyl-D-alanine carboxypeptidase [Oscillospiraceae bacterium]